MTKIFLDGGNLKDIKEYAKNPLIKGFTTNPSLLKKEKIKNFKDFSNSCILCFIDTILRVLFNSSLFNK